MAASIVDLEASHARYEEALSLKSSSLPERDAWYRTELRDLVRTRAKTEQGAHLTKDELIRLMKWKLTRGKFRPRLEMLAASNTVDAVYTSTKKGFSILFSKEDIMAALKAMTELKGVGPAFASGLLALARPDWLPYMSDEVLAHGVGKTEKPKYNDKEYLWLVEQSHERIMRERRMTKSGYCCLESAEDFEKAAWAYGVLTANDRFSPLKDEPFQRTSAKNSSPPVKKQRKK